MTKHLIFGIHVSDRQQSAIKVQQVLSEFGCNIKTRIGLHDVDENFCSPKGLIILECFGEDNKCCEMYEKLTAIEGVEVQKIMFGGECNCAEK